MPSLGTQCEKMGHAGTAMLLLGALTLSVASANSLVVVNPNFSAVAVQCGSGYAYQTYMSGNCASPGTSAQQPFDSEIGIAWDLAPLPGDGDASLLNGDGITKPNTTFNPPPFTGLPFSDAAFLRGVNSQVVQTITGFVPGGLYTLSFYLGSRYASGSFDGNQTVEALIDGQVIGTWSLVSFTPFTLETALFTVGTGGSHKLKFMGTATGDHTAFVSGVSIETAGGLTVNPTSVFPGFTIAVSASGFAPSETVDLVGYASSSGAAIGTGTTDSSGNVAITCRIPQTPFGSYGLQAIGTTSKTVVPGTIGIVPEILVSPRTAPIGGSLTVQGYGFAAGEALFVTWLSPSSSLGSSTANADGTFPELTVTVPAGASVGANTLIVTDQRSGAIASAQINVN